MNIIFAFQVTSEGQYHKRIQRAGQKRDTSAWTLNFHGVQMAREPDSPRTTSWGDCTGAVDCSLQRSDHKKSLQQTTRQLTSFSTS